jgi:hypothetical protein
LIVLVATRAMAPIIARFMLRMAFMGRVGRHEGRPLPIDVWVL